MLKQVKLKDVAFHSKGKQINNDALIESGLYDYLNGGINPSGKWNDFNTESNTVTISEGGNSSGYVNFMTRPFWCGAHCYYLYDVKIQPKYLYYALKSQEYRLMSLRTGSTMPNIKKSTLAEFDFQIDIDSNSQKQIESILDIISELIFKKNQQLAEYDQLIKSRFVEMFGNQQLNPFKWKQTRLKDLSLEKLSYGSGASAIYYNGLIRYVRITDINELGSLNNDIKSPSIYEEKYKLVEGDILFARSGATVGKTFRYRSSDGECIYAGYLIRFKPNTKVVLPDYVFHYTKSNFYNLFIEKTQNVVAQPNINAKQFGDLVINVPPIELQREFTQFVDQVNKLRFALQESLNETQQLFDSLMQEYFG